MAGYLTLSLLLNSVACEYHYAVLLNKCVFYSTFNMDTLHGFLVVFFRKSLSIKGCVSVCVCISE